MDRGIGTILTAAGGAALRRFPAFSDKLHNIGAKIETKCAVLYGALQMETGAAVREYIDSANHENGTLPVIIICGQNGYFRDLGKFFREQTRIEPLFGEFNRPDTSGRVSSRQFSPFQVQEPAREK